MKKFNSIEDLVGAIAIRVEELGNMKMSELRYWHPENYGGPMGGTVSSDLKVENRGQCIASIILEEFQDVEVEN